MPTNGKPPGRAESREIEMKLPLRDPAGLRARLRQVGARYVSRVFEINRMFDTPDAMLRRQDRGLRIRVNTLIEDVPSQAASCPVAGKDAKSGRSTDSGKTPQPVALLTCKGPRIITGVKSREEIELQVQDAERMAQVLERLGFIQTVLYEKRRETWTLDDCEVLLDELPELGWWVEIEGPSESAIHAVRDRLALTGKPVSSSYAALAAASVAADDSSFELTFPSG